MTYAIASALPYDRVLREIVRPYQLQSAVITNSQIVHMMDLQTYLHAHKYKHFGHAQHQKQIRHSCLQVTCIVKDHAVWGFIPCCLHTPCFCHQAGEFGASVSMEESVKSCYALPCILGILPLQAHEQMTEMSNLSVFMLMEYAALLLLMPYTWFQEFHMKSKLFRQPMTTVTEQ